MSVFAPNPNQACRALTPAERAKEHLDSADRALRDFHSLTRSIGAVYGDALGLLLDRRIENIVEHLGEGLYHLGEAEKEQDRRTQELYGDAKALRNCAHSLHTWLTKAVEWAKPFDADRASTKSIPPIPWTGPASSTLDAAEKFGFHRHHVLHAETEVEPF